VKCGIIPRRKLTWLCSGQSPDALHAQDAKPNVDSYHETVEKPVSETSHNL